MNVRVSNDPRTIANVSKPATFTKVAGLKCNQDDGASDKLVKYIRLCIYLLTKEFQEIQKCRRQIPNQNFG